MPKRTNIIVGCINRHPDNNIDDFNQLSLRFFGWTLINLPYAPNFSSFTYNGSTKTLIDNIFCNIPQSSEQNISVNLTTTYSDHLSQVLLVPGFYRYKNVCKSNAFIGDWKNFNNATFSADYKSTDWPNVMQIDKGNPNLSFHN